MEFNLPIGLKGMEILATLFSPSQLEIGILIIGENYKEGAAQPIVRVYLLGAENDEWFIEDELQAFAFPTLQSAAKFAGDLPEMSALDLLLLMNGHSRKNGDYMFIH